MAYKNGQLLNAKHPYLHSINGFTWKALWEKTQELVQNGSSQFVETYGLVQFREMGSILTQLGMYKPKEIVVKLADESGNTTSLTQNLVFGRKKSTKTKRDFSLTTLGDFRYKVLKENIGYINIPTMASGENIASNLEKIFQEMASTKGLIIDVRGNSGGSRQILTELMPYLMNNKQAPVVVNVAATRVTDDSTPPEGYLENRYLYPITSKTFNAAEKKAIHEFLTTFAPEWVPDPHQYSDWHFMVLSPGKNVWTYNQPVVVLMDSYCFSATDVFLGALGELEHVTLLGTRSSGGSGRVQTYTLPNSIIEVRLSSMASFQPNGKLYDGNGITPDIEMQPVKEDILGHTDTFLQKAVETLKGKQR